MLTAEQILRNVSLDSLKSLSDSEQIELLNLLEIEYRQQAKSNYLRFIQSIDIPGAPVKPEDPDCEEFYPDKIIPAKHHHLVIQLLQAVYDKKVRRAMIMAPPGSAKSTYTTVCFPPFAMATPKTNIICASYGSDLARKFGRKCRSIVKSRDYLDITNFTLSSESSAADEWSLNNQSEYMSGGIRSGMTGNRAHGLLIDDPVKGRQEADSEAVQKSTWEAYNDDLLTRLIPGGWQIIIQTRWNELDLSGRLLPENYDGKTGFVKCTDGHMWYVLNLPMECERDDDPLGRKPGDLLWSDWFIRDDILAIKHNEAQSRTWNSLYQQRPSSEEGDYFKKEWFNWYEEPPKHLRIYGASDYAVTDGAGDYTVHVVVGIDPNDDIYILDLWRKQTKSDEWVDTFLDLVKKYDPLQWAEEQGQIIKSLGPFIKKIMLEKKVFCYREQYVSAVDKPTRARSFQARASMGKVYLPKTSPWVNDLVSELTRFPTGVNDDQVDALSLIGRILDQMVAGKKPPPPPKKKDRWDKAFNGSGGKSSLSSKGY